MGLPKTSWYTREQLAGLTDRQLREAEWTAVTDYMYYACAEGDCYSREREARREQGEYFSMVNEVLESRGLQQLRKL